MQLTATQEKIAYSWKALEPHKVQNEVFSDNIRFKVVAAGRRSGKTEIAKRIGVARAFAKPRARIVFMAPTLSQAVRIYWEDVVDKSSCLLEAAGLKSTVNKSSRTIALPNGSKIEIASLARPERVEGAPIDLLVLDELADAKPGIFQKNLRPLVDTKGREGYIMMVGTPNRLGDDFHALYLKGLSGEATDWKSYHWKSADILSEETILSARRSMDALSFQREYEAAFIAPNGRIYQDFSEENLCDRRLLPHETIIWTHDFNYSPLSSCILTREGNAIYAVQEIVLEGAVAMNAAEEFITRFKDHENKRVQIFGDASGKAGEKHRQLSNYITIENHLKENGWTVERFLRAKNPSIVDRQNCVRAKIRNGLGERSLFIDRHNCRTLIDGFNTVQFMDGSSFLEKETRSQHITTAIGYCIEYLFPILFMKETVKPSTNYSPAPMWSGLNASR